MNISILVYNYSTASAIVYHRRYYVHYLLAVWIGYLMGIISHKSKR